MEQEWRLDWCYKCYWCITYLFKPSFLKTAVSTKVMLCKVELSTWFGSLKMREKLMQAHLSKISSSLFGLVSTLNGICNHTRWYRYPHMEECTITLILFLCSCCCKSMLPSDYQYQLLFLVGFKAVHCFLGRILWDPLNEDLEWYASDNEKPGSLIRCVRNIWILLQEVFFLPSVANLWD